MAQNEQLVAGVAGRNDRLTSLKNEMVENENLISTASEEQASEFDQFNKHIEDLSKELDKKIDSSKQEKFSDYASAYSLISKITHFVNNAQFLSKALPSAANYSKSLKAVLLRRTEENADEVPCVDSKHYSSEALSEWAKQAYPSNPKIAEAIKEINFNGSILPQTLQNENSQSFLSFVHITAPEDIKVWTTKWREEVDKRREVTNNSLHQKQVLANLESLKLILSGLQT